MGMDGHGERAHLTTLTLIDNGIAVAPHLAAAVVAMPTLEQLTISSDFGPKWNESMERILAPDALPRLTTLKLTGGGSVHSALLRRSLEAPSDVVKRMKCLHMDCQHMSPATKAALYSEAIAGFTALESLSVAEHMPIPASLVALKEVRVMVPPCRRHHADATLKATFVRTLAPVTANLRKLEVYGLAEVEGWDLRNLRELELVDCDCGILRLTSDRLQKLSLSRMKLGQIVLPSSVRSLHIDRVFPLLPPGLLQGLDDDDALRPLVEYAQRCTADWDRVLSAAVGATSSSYRSKASASSYRSKASASSSWRCSGRASRKTRAWRRCACRLPTRARCPRTRSSASSAT